MTDEPQEGIGGDRHHAEIFSHDLQGSLSALAANGGATPDPDAVLADNFRVLAAAATFASVRLGVPSQDEAGDWFVPVDNRGEFAVTGVSVRQTTDAIATLEAELPPNSTARLQVLSGEPVETWMFRTDLDALTYTTFNDVGGQGPQRLVGGDDYGRALNELVELLGDGPALAHDFGPSLGI